MLFTIPNSWGSELHESNDCHEPGGQSTGGQFCGDGSSTADSTANAWKSLRQKWDQINQKLLGFLRNANAPEVRTLVDEQKQIVKDILRLDARPSGLDPDTLRTPGGVRDVVIIGAGPGGMTAAIGAGYEQLDALMIDANATPGGAAQFSSRVENFPTLPIGASGEQLASSMYDQATRLGIETKLGTRVTSLTHDPETGLKTLTLSNGETVQATSVIIATGLAFKKIKFPGDDANNVIYGDGEKLAKASEGKPVVIIGGSNGAAQAALRASQTSSSVVVLARRALDDGGMSRSQISALRNNPKITVIEGDEIKSMVKDASGNPVEVKTVGGKTLPAAALGMFIGQTPVTGWLKGFKTGVGGFLEASPTTLETNVPGVFAVGDIRQGGGGRMIVAAGEGGLAIRSVFEYFHKLDKAKGKKK